MGQIRRDLGGIDMFSGSPYLKLIFKDAISVPENDLSSTVVNF
jgi:hypothetical protein